MNPLFFWWQGSVSAFVAPTTWDVLLMVPADPQTYVVPADPQTVQIPADAQAVDVP